MSEKKKERDDAGPVLLGYEPSLVHVAEPVFDRRRALPITAPRFEPESAEFESTEHTAPMRREPPH